MRWRYACLVVGMVVWAGSVLAQAPPNLSQLKKALTRYHDSGEYVRDVGRAVDAAQRRLAQRLEREPQAGTVAPQSHERPAIVLDIDETALSNYSRMAEADFGGTRSEVWAAFSRGGDPAILPVLHLYQYAVLHGVAVFFISGRPESIRAATEKNLRAAGYTRWAGLLLRPDEYRETSIVPFKSQTRRKIETQGYDILLNVGDQASDLAGGYADDTSRLPDPFYFIS